MISAPHEPLGQRPTSPSCAPTYHNSSRLDRHGRRPWRRTRDYGADPTTSVPQAARQTHSSIRTPRPQRGHHTHVHTVTTLGARRIDGGPSGRFVLTIDRAGLFVSSFYDSPQLLLVKRRASRANVVNGRFAFVDDVSSAGRWRKVCKSITWRLFSPLRELHGFAQRYGRKSRWTMIEVVQCNAHI